MATENVRTAAKNAAATTSGPVTSIDTARRLGETTARGSDIGPQTPDELIDSFVKGFDFFTREQMLEAIDSGVFEIFRLTASAWALIEFVPTRYGKTMNILTVAGSRDQWEPGWVSIEKIAHDNECGMIYSVGHPGWKRFMEERGFRTEPMMKMIKEVT